MPLTLYGLYVLTFVGLFIGMATEIAPLFVTSLIIIPVYKAITLAVRAAEWAIRKLEAREPLD